VRDRLELQQHRERAMLAIIESARDLSSRLDLTSLLSAIVSRARNLLSSDLGWLSIYDAEREEFRVLVTDGTLSPRTSSMVARRDRGVASIVMSTQLPFTTPDYLGDKRFAHDATLDETLRDEGIAALVGVPLIWESDVIGLLFVADRYHRIHAAQSTSILCTLATHAAVALKNAREFERANAAVAKAELARAELERHVRSIESAADAHEKMTSLLASGASLSTLCHAIAQLLGGSMLVLDEAGEVLSRGAAPGYSGAGAQTYAQYGEHSAELSRDLLVSRRTGPSVIRGVTLRGKPVRSHDRHRW
jgi:transcriptional regulator with GAF, ATPase, and Fis domain